MGWKFRLKLAALVSLLPIFALGVSTHTQPQPTTPPAAAAEPDVVKVADADDAVAQFLAVLQTIPEQYRRHYRAVWNSTGEMPVVRTTSLTLGYLSRGTLPLLPPYTPDKQLILVDLRAYAPQPQDYEEFAATWEQLQFDPAFSLLITRDTIDFIEQFQKQFGGHKTRHSVVKQVTKRVAVPGPKTTKKITIDHPGGPYVWPDDSGRRHKNLAPGKYAVELEFNGPETFKDVTEDVVEEVEDTVAGSVDVKDIDVIRLNPPHINPSKFALLQQQTHSLAPIVEYRYFQKRALDSIKDSGNAQVKTDGVYRTVFSGLYYDFRGIKKAKDVLGQDTKVTDFQLFLATFGGYNLQDTPNNAQDLFNRLRSDRRILKLISEVTKKPRVGFDIPVLTERDGARGGMFTGDVKDEDIGQRRRAHENLLDPEFVAIEAIFPGRNSLDVYGIFDAVTGNRLNEVPFNVAHDTTVPDGHTKRLQTKSCLVCHHIFGEDGWKVFPNDALKLTKGKLGLDIFDDFGDKRHRAEHDNYDVIDRLAGLYSGSQEKNFRRKREDVSEATLRVTGPWLEGKDEEERDTTKICKVAVSRWNDDYRTYTYDAVTAETALREMGWKVKPEKALEVFAQLVPPDVRNNVAGVFVPEDANIGALRLGLAIPRSDWSFSQAFATERAKRTWAAQRQMPRKVQP